MRAPYTKFPGKAFENTLLKIIIIVIMDSSFRDYHFNEIT